MYLVLNFAVDGCTVRLLRKKNRQEIPRHIFYNITGLAFLTSPKKFCFLNGWCPDRYASELQGIMSKIYN